MILQLDTKQFGAGKCEAPKPDASKITVGTKLAQDRAGLVWQPKTLPSRDLCG